MGQKFAFLQKKKKKSNNCEEYFLEKFKESQETAYFRENFGKS